MPGENMHRQFQRRLNALKAERAGWLSHWRELAEYTLPRRGRFLVSDRNKGDKKNSRIVDGSATLALRALTSGMMAGLTNPAVPWFRLALPERELMEFMPVKLRLESVERSMRRMFNASNLYQCLPAVYEELGVFGTAAVSVVADEEDGLRCRVYTAGEYFLAQNHKMQVDTFYRECAMTVEQVAGQFGLDNVSARLRTQYDRGNYDDWVDIVHLVEPNREMRGGKIETDLPYRSVYFEASGARGGLLSQSGFPAFPVMAPRWFVMAPDVYGRSPGMDALGDIKALQLEQKRKAEAIEKMVRPPMIAPTSLRRASPTILPGGVTYVDVVQGQVGFQPAYQVNPRINELILDIRDSQDRIGRTFYADLFLMMLESDRRTMTAAEVAERHEEKLLMLGPVLDRLHKDLLRPLVERGFDIMRDGNMLPPAPPELAGTVLEVEFVSLLAQAQRQVNAGGIERLAGFVASLAPLDPKAADKLDVDRMIDEYAEISGAPAKILRPREALEKRRAEQGQQQAQGQMLAQAPALAQGVKALGQTPGGDGGSVLDGLMAAAGGAAAGPLPDGLAAIAESVTGEAAP